MVAHSRAFQVTHQIHFEREADIYRNVRGCWHARRNQSWRRTWKSSWGAVHVQYNGNFRSCAILIAPSYVDGYRLLRAKVPVYRLCQFKVPDINNLVGDRSEHRVRVVREFSGVRYRCTLKYAASAPETLKVVQPLVLGTGVGSHDGRPVGSNDGDPVGSEVGKPVGRNVGSSEGSAVGARVGTAVGNAVGCKVGRRVGSPEGRSVGENDGSRLGRGVGEVVGLAEGGVDGRSVGAGVG